MKKLLLIIASLFLVSTMASANSIQNDFVNLNKSDSNFLFKADTKVISLNNMEMKNTKGQYGFWGAIAGASSGAYGYIGHSMSSQNFSYGGLAGSMIAGAGAGLVLPTPSAMSWAATSHAAIFGGFLSGFFY